MSDDDSESHYKTMEVIIVQSIIKSVLDSIEAITEISLVTLSSLVSSDNSESHIIGRVTRGLSEIASIESQTRSLVTGLPSLVYW